MELIFRALAHPDRRLLLDRLFERDGQPLGELAAHLPSMTRFGVMRHLGVLEEAGLVTTHRSGREKLHYLNPVPIRLVHDRWIGKFAEPVVARMVAIKHELEASSMERPDHVYAIYIKASPERIWRAMTDGTETARYFYGTSIESDFTPGSRVVYTYPDGRLASEGEILEVEPPHRLVMTFQALWDPDLVAEGPVTESWVLEAVGEGTTKLTVTMSGIVPGSKTEADFAGGIVFIVSGLKTYVESGEALAVDA